MCGDVFMVRAEQLWNPKQKLHHFSKSKFCFQVLRRCTQTFTPINKPCTYQHHLVISLSSAVSWILMSLWFVQIVPCEFWYSLKQMAGSAQRETGHLVKFGTERHSGLSPGGWVFFIHFLIYSFEIWIIILWARCGQEGNTYEVSDKQCIIIL